jgi:hypothetical protein
MRFSSLLLASTLAFSLVNSLAVRSAALDTKPEQSPLASLTRDRNAPTDSIQIAQATEGDPSTNSPSTGGPSNNPEPAPVDDTVFIIDLEDELTDEDSPSPVSGSVYDEYLFVGRAGQEVDISVNSPDFDTYLLLIGPDGELVAENDDITPGNLNSAIATELPMNGNYLVVVTSFFPQERGAYTLEATTTLGTGDLQATLQWNSIHDLDLAVMDPSGEIVAFDNSLLENGGQLDVDANAICESLTDSPVENIFWPPDQAPQGDYVVAVSLYSRCDDSTEPIPFTLTLTVQGSTEVLTGTLDEENNIVTFSTAIY